MEVYNKNRDNNHSMHDEIREQNAKLKGAPFREKLSYFQEYYLKTTLLVICRNLYRIHSAQYADRPVGYGICRILLQRYRRLVQHRTD